MNKDNQYILIILILFMGILSPILIDEYAPSMPAMAHALNTSTGAIQLTITFMLLGLSLGQIILGPLSDRYGRRPIVMLGIVLAIVASFICIFATNETYLFLGRFLQGFGVASAGLTTTALIGESFKGDDVNRITSLFVLVYGFVPIIAPVIGGHIQEAFGWRGNFVFLLIPLTIALIFFWFFMPETIDRRTSPRLSPSSLFQSYRIVVTNKRYMSAVIGAMFSWSTIISFSLLAPFLIQSKLGYSASAYGYFGLVAGLGFLLGNFVNTKALKKFESATMLRAGIYISLMAGILIVALTTLGAETIWTIMVPSILILFGVGLTFPTYYGFAVSVFTENNVGIANALIGALILIGTVTFSVILTAFHAHSFHVLAGTYLLLGTLNFASSFFCLSQQATS